VNKERLIMNIMMKKIFLRSVMAGILALFSAGACFAGAWTQQKGKLYDRLSLNYYFADDEFNERSRITDFAANGEYWDLNLGNYIEYGLTDRITLINSLYLKHIHKEDDFQKTNTYGIGDIDLAAKFKLSEGRWGVLSTQALVKIPETYDKDARLPLGNGQYDVELRLLYGKSLWPYIPGYCNFELGYRWRFDDPSDEFRYLAEFGMDITKSLYGRIKLDAILSMNNGSKFDISGNPTATNNFNLGKLDMTVGYKILKRWGLEVEYTPEIYGKNTAAGATYSLALVYQIP
jgi:hypothetical protein